MKNQRYNNLTKEQDDILLNISKQHPMKISEIKSLAKEDDIQLLTKINLISEKKFKIYLTKKGVEYLDRKKINEEIIDGLINLFKFVNQHEITDLSSNDITTFKNLTHFNQVTFFWIIHYAGECKLIRSSLSYANNIMSVKISENGVKYSKNPSRNIEIPYSAKDESNGISNLLDFLLDRPKNNEEDFRDLSEQEFLLQFPDSLWIQFLSDNIINNPNETFFWDYKAKSALEHTIRNSDDKIKKNEEMAKDISCFSNSESGLIIFGIDDNGLLVGTKDPISLSDKIKKLQNYFTSTPTYYTKIIDFIDNVSNQEFKLLILIIAKMNKPIGVKFKTDKGDFVRYYQRNQRDCDYIKSDNEIAFIQKKSSSESFSFPVLDIVRKLNS